MYKLIRRAYTTMLSRILAAHQWWTIPPNTPIQNTWFNIPGRAPASIPAEPSSEPDLRNYCLPAPGVFELNQAQQTCGTEPHGVLRFTGIFSQVSWDSLSNEFWNGFTVGVQGTDDQVFPCQVDPTLPQCQPNNDVPEPMTLTLMGLGLAGLGFSRKRKAL